MRHHGRPRGPGNFLGLVVALFACAFVLFGLSSVLEPDIGSPPTVTAAGLSAYLSAAEVLAASPAFECSTPLALVDTPRGAPHGVRAGLAPAAVDRHLLRSGRDRDLRRHLRMAADLPRRL